MCECDNLQRIIQNIVKEPFYLFLINLLVKNSVNILSIKLFWNWPLIINFCSILNPKYRCNRSVMQWWEWSGSEGYCWAL